MPKSPIATFARGAALVLVMAAGSNAQPARAAIKIVLINAQGATAPCIVIGPFASLQRNCIKSFESAGFLPIQDVGVTGLTLGNSPGDDGRITAIVPGSPAAQAVLQPGDAVLAVDGRFIRPTPGTLAEQRIFGARGEPLRLQLRRKGGSLDITFVRAPLAPPSGPKSPSFFVFMHPLIDWRNHFIPCMAGGPAAPAVFIYCDHHFKPFGYIKAGDLGTSGIRLDLTRADAAIITAVVPESPAAAAGVQRGDEILEVNGQALAPNLTKMVYQRLFGKAGDTFRVTVQRAGVNRTVTLSLAPRETQSAL